jgi:osmotically-inducible protein OsmY
MRRLDLALSGIVLSVLSFQLVGCAPLVVGGAAAAGGAAAYDRRTTGAYVDDEIIEWKALGRLNQDDAIRTQTHLNVTSVDGVVLISGEAPTEALRTRAAELVRGIEKVRRVHNEVVLAAPSAMSSRSSDTWITAKVKTKLFGINDIPGFSAMRVKVVTENGTVFLMGKLYRREVQAVTETVRTVPGVQRIVRLFEYLD